MSDRLVIEVRNLTKRYGNTLAVDGISFEVRKGEIFAVVGPNGAGKTTTLESLQGLRRADEGEIRVLGHDPRRERAAIIERLGIQFQETRLWARIRVSEALALFASFYRCPANWEALLEPLGLTEKRNAAFSELSGGQKQRLFVGLALVGDPELLFLDEITTGLDPHARRAMWKLIHELQGRGKTVVLSTHFLEEAENLADRVAIMDRGRFVALGTPATLIRDLGSESWVEFIASNGFQPEAFGMIAGVTRVDCDGERVVIAGTGERLTAGVVSRLDEIGSTYSDLRSVGPSLEHVFLKLTGHQMRD